MHAINRNTIWFDKRRGSPCQKEKFSECAWQAEMGGWWQTWWSLEKSAESKTRQKNLTTHNQTRQQYLSSQSHLLTIIKQIQPLRRRLTLASFQVALSILSPSNRRCTLYCVCFMCLFLDYCTDSAAEPEIPSLLFHAFCFLVKIWRLQYPQCNLTGNSLTWDSGVLY